MTATQHSQRWCGLISRGGALLTVVERQPLPLYILTTLLRRDAARKSAVV